MYFLFITISLKVLEYTLQLVKKNPTVFFNLM